MPFELFTDRKVIFGEICLSFGVILRNLQGPLIWFHYFEAVILQNIDDDKQEANRTYIFVGEDLMILEFSVFEVIFVVIRIFYHERTDFITEPELYLVITHLRNFNCSSYN